MTRIYEALRQVEQEKAPNRSVIDFPGIANAGYSNEVQVKMRELYRTMLRHLPGQRGRVIQFLGPRNG